MKPANSIQRISFIGAGNVATHLAMGFKRIGKEISEVYSQNSESRKNFSQKFACKAVESPGLLDKSVDLFLIAIPDKEIEKFGISFPEVNGILAHTSGFSSINTLNGHRHFGVFYPLQTFSKNIDIELKDVPFCIEASDKQTETELIAIASELSKNVHLISSEQRKKLHLAAVLVSNFTNLLYSEAYNFLCKNELDFELLLPLIKEVARKVNVLEPALAQTGPARRNDTLTINEHIKMLVQFPEIQELYILMSEQIRKKYHE